MCDTIIGMRILLTWIGSQDPWKPKQGRRTGHHKQMPFPRPPDYKDGPILTFLTASSSFDKIYLLHDKKMKEVGGLEATVGALSEWFSERNILPRYIPLDDPREYKTLYGSMRAVCEEARNEHGDDVSYNILLSSGTPQMHATWVLLSKTVFKSQAWQTSEHDGCSRAEIVDIPFDIYTELIDPAVRKSRGELTPVVTDMIADSLVMRKLLKTISLAAPSDHTVLIQGESGVGKELVAKAIHYSSPRSQHNLVSVNCSALPENLIESELFGHKKGAFTGATKDKEGLFVKAQEGTIFLDEIGELPLSHQVKLLRVLQENTIRPVGSNEEISINVRVIAATNNNLEKQIHERTFRKDLYFRLAVIPVAVAPLCERRDDIQPLIDLFMKKANKERVKRNILPFKLKPKVRRRMASYAWPGNVRELENVVKRMGALVQGEILDIEEFEEMVPIFTSKNTHVLYDGEILDDKVLEYERSIIEKAIKKYGTQAAAARALGLNSPQALQGKMRKWKK